MNELIRKLQSVSFLSFTLFWLLLFRKILDRFKRVHKNINYWKISYFCLSFAEFRREYSQYTLQDMNALFNIQYYSLFIFNQHNFQDDSHLQPKLWNEFNSKKKKDNNPTRSDSLTDNKSYKLRFSLKLGMKMYIK